MTSLSQEALKVIEKVKKLLALSKDKGATEAEAQVAAAKAMELLHAHNLDMLTVERSKNAGSSQREDAKLSGGLYRWQRQLWESVSELHFCMYWAIKGLDKGSKYEHRVLGSQVNVVGTKVMAEYLQQTIDRLAGEWAKQTGNHFFSKSAISYREGMSSRICSRLRELKWEGMEADRKKQDEERMRTRHPAAAPGTALVLADVAQSEREANDDYLYGDGYSARQRAANAEWDVEYQKRKAAREEWGRAHPEEHARQQAEEAARAERWRKKEERNAKRRKGVIRQAQYKGDSEAY